MFNIKSNQSGATLVLVLSITIIFLASAMGLISLGMYRNKLYLQQSAKEQALHIAEAGANYYRWHLAHDLEDYADGTADICVYPNSCGPYEHTFYEPSGSITGTYSLEITPPPVGSTIVKVKSTGWVNDYPNIKRTIEIRYGVPSFAAYAVVINSNVRFGSGTEIFGPLHSNGGIRFDGVAHNLVASAVQCYDDPDTTTVDTCERPGVWTSQPDESLVFLSGKNFPVTPVDFTAVTADLAQMKADAQSEGVYLPYDNNGYRIHFNSNGTFDIYKIDQLTSKGWIYDGDSWVKTSYDIQSETLQSSANTIPSNGIIFVETNVWVDGIVKGKVTVASGRFPENPNNYTNITIVNDIVYAAKDGSNNLGLIAQKNVQIGYYSEDNLEINAAILAQNGKFYRPYYYYYEPTQSHNLRDTITIYGSIAMSKRYVLLWCCYSGYWTRNINYDNSLVYSPPPSFPTIGEYVFISWEEK